MIVYHASYRYFSNPNLKYAKLYRDFGKGFYLTENYIDALNILKNKTGYIYKFNLDLTNLKVLHINEEDILNKIIQFRTQDDNFDYDVIIGKTAAGNVSKLFKALRYNNNNLDALKKEINFSIFDDQICLKSNKAINKLELLEIEDIYE